MGFSVSVSRYDEHPLCGSRLELPATDAEIEEFLIEAGLSDYAPEGIRVTGYDSLCGGLDFAEVLHADDVALEELSLLASVIDAFPDAAVKVSALLDATGVQPATVLELSNWIAQGEDLPFAVFPHRAGRAHDEHEFSVGRDWVFAHGGIDEALTDAEMAEFFDYKAYGWLLADRQGLSGGLFAWDDGGFIDLRHGNPVAYDPKAALDAAIALAPGLFSGGIPRERIEDAARSVGEALGAVPDAPADAMWLAAKVLADAAAASHGTPAIDGARAYLRIVHGREAGLTGGDAACVLMCAERIDYTGYSADVMRIPDIRERLGVAVARKDGLSHDTLKELFDYAAFGRAVLASDPRRPLPSPPRQMMAMPRGDAYSAEELSRLCAERAASAPASGAPQPACARAVSPAGAGRPAR